MLKQTGEATTAIDLNDVKWKTIEDLLKDYLNETNQKMYTQKFIQKFTDWGILTIEDLKAAEVSKEELLKENGMGPSRVEILWKALEHNRLDNPIVLGTSYEDPSESTTLKTLRHSFIEKKAMNKFEKSALAQLINSLSISGIKTVKDLRENKKSNYYLKQLRSKKAIGDAGIKLLEEMLQKFGFENKTKATN